MRYLLSEALPKEGHVKNWLRSFCSKKNLWGCSEANICLLSLKAKIKLNSHNGLSHEYTLERTRFSFKFPACIRTWPMCLAGVLKYTSSIFLCVISWGKDQNYDSRTHRPIFFRQTKRCHPQRIIFDLPFLSKTWWVTLLDWGRRGIACFSLVKSHLPRT